MALRKIKIHYIYKLTAPNGKSYIGRTVNFKDMLQRHLKSDYPIGRAFRKYEPKNFKVEILWITIDETVANSIEIAAIKIYKSIRPNGYNITLGGQGTTGHSFIPSTKWRKKQSKAKTGDKNPMRRPEVAAKFKGKPSPMKNNLIGALKQRRTKLKKKLEKELKND